MTMQLATEAKPLFSAYLKDEREFYITEKEAVVMDPKKGRVFSLDISQIRCAYPVAGDTVMLFWTGTKTFRQGAVQLKKFNYPLELDLEMMFPDKKERRAAEKDASEKLALNILGTVSQFYNNARIMPSFLTLHANELLMGEFDGQTKYGKGQLIVTTAGAYFVVLNKGLVFDMPLKLLDAFDSHEKTLTIHYIEPTWDLGNKGETKKNRMFEIRINGRSAEEARDILKSAYTDGGAKSAREYTELFNKYSMMNPDQLFDELYSGQIYDGAEVYRFIDMMGRMMYGERHSTHSILNDRGTLRASMLLDESVEIVHQLDPDDIKYREKFREYNEYYGKYMSTTRSLVIDYKKLVCTNLDDDSKEEIEKMGVFLIHEALVHIAKTGDLPKDEDNKTLMDIMEIIRHINIKFASEGCITMDFPIDYPTKNYWSKNSATTILNDPDYRAIFKRIEEEAKKFGKKFKTFKDGKFALLPEMYPLLFKNRHEIALSKRSLALYNVWKENVELPTQTDPYNPEWIKYAQSLLDEDRLEKSAAWKGSEKNPLEAIRDAFAKSDSQKSRLERIVIPDNIEKSDIYGDAWYDKESKVWFTTNPYKPIIDSPEKSVPIDEAEHKYGVRATVFDESKVTMRHGFPCIFDEKMQAWIILTTLRDDQITREMVLETLNLMRDRRNLAHHENPDGETPVALIYDNIEPRVTISPIGQPFYMTEVEAKVYAETMGYEPVPFEERLRRFIYYCLSGITVGDSFEPRPLIYPTDYNMIEN